MAQVGEFQTEVVAGNVRDIVNRLSRDMTNRTPFSLHQVDRRPPAVPQPQLFVVTYPYTATQTDELSFAVGDTVELLSEVEDGWSRGKLRSTGAVGMYPTNFVTAKPAVTSTSTSTPSSASTSSSSSARPKTNDVVMRTEPKAIERTPSTILADQTLVLKPAESAKTSTFSATSTTTTIAASASTESAQETGKTKEMARVKFVYNPQHGDELALADLDVLINITNKNCGDAGWFEGELHGKKGLFPDNFVELVQVPVKTESGAKYASVSRQTALNFVSNKPPPVNPPQPAVPPKPAKIVAVDSSSVPSQSTSTPSVSSAMPAVSSAAASTPVKNNFEALRMKMSTNLKVVAPEQVSSVQLKPAEQRERALSEATSVSGDSTADTTGGGDQVSELQHITKNRARPPKSRPMSMVMNRNRSSDESPSGGRLSSPTSSTATSAMSASMFVPPVAKEVTIPSNSSATPFKIAPSVVPPSSASKPALRPIITEESLVTRKLASPENLKSGDQTPSSDFVSRAEYDALLDRFRALESRVIALEKLRL